MDKYKKNKIINEIDKLIKDCLSIESKLDIKNNDEQFIRKELFKSRNMLNGVFLELIQNKKNTNVEIKNSEYWILDGAEKAFELKEEIKMHNGRWIPEHKAWCISTNKESDSYKFLKSIGLILQFRR